MLEHQSYPELAAEILSIHEIENRQHREESQGKLCFSFLPLFLSAFSALVMLFNFSQLSSIEQVHKFYSGCHWGAQERRIPSVQKKNDGRKEAAVVLWAFCLAGPLQRVPNPQRGLATLEQSWEPVSVQCCRVGSRTCRCMIAADAHMGCHKNRLSCSLPDPCQIFCSEWIKLVKLVENSYLLKCFLLG